MSDLQELIGQSLTRKDGKTVTIMSVSLTLYDMKIPGDALLNFSSSRVSHVPQHVGTPVVNKNDL